MDLLRDDAFLTPGEGSGGGAEGEQEPKTNVQLGVGTGHTAQHTNMHTQGGDHRGADCNIHQAVTAKLTTNNLINQGGSEGTTLEAGKANDGGEEPSAGGKRAEAQKEEEPERRLCGGCHKPQGREKFEAHEWQKADAWSREAARRCQKCALTRAQPPAGGDVQGRRASKRAAAWRAQREEQEDSAGECDGRQLEQVLCPRGCECGNALAASGSPEVVQVVQGGGGELAAKGSMAIENITQGAIITCFGNSASVRAGPAGDELQSLMNELEEGESEWCQYTCAHNLQGDARFGSMKVWVVPPPDITLILRQEPSDTLKDALKRRGPTGRGQDGRGVRDLRPNSSAYLLIQPCTIISSSPSTSNMAGTGSWQVLT